jgi:hypothetical protein
MLIRTPIWKVATPPDDPRPWTSGPEEILEHGLGLLQEDTDKARRLAMLSIDNAVELIVKTYLGLPKRVTGLQIALREFQDFSERFRGY